VDLWVGFARRREQIAVCYLGGRDLCALGPSRFLLGSISPESATASPKRATEVDQTAADRVIACSPPHQGGCWDVIQRERARCSSAAGCQPPARLSDSQQLLANKSADLSARSLAETGQIPSPTATRRALAGRHKTRHAPTRPLRILASASLATSFAP